MRLIIVMPVYNEEGCIRKVISDWTELLENKFPNDNSCIIAINDGSKDNSADILEELTKNNTRLTVYHQKNGGHGNALISGYNKAIMQNPEWILHIDSDDQVCTSDFDKLWDSRKNTMMAIGYRKIRHDDTIRLIVTRILRLFILTVYQVKIKDSNIPFRLINTKLLDAILGEIPTNTFAPNILISILAGKLRQDLQECPIVHKDRETGQVSIIKFGLIKVCFRSLFEFIKFRISLPSRLTKIKNILDES
jgi:dolichol-phosphate mannosyltransferase